MENKTFGSMDIRFKNTSLGRKKFESWAYTEEEIKADFEAKKEEALKLVCLYDEFKGKIKLSYPAYYVKGKNGPYYTSICFQPKDFRNFNYSYYRGIYISCGNGCYTVYVDGNEITNEETLKKLLSLDKNEKKFLSYFKLCQ